MKSVRGGVVLAALTLLVGVFPVLVTALSLSVGWSALVGAAAAGAAYFAINAAYKMGYAESHGQWIAFIEKVAEIDHEQLD